MVTKIAQYQSFFISTLQLNLYLFIYCYIPYIKRKKQRFSSTQIPAENCTFFKGIASFRMLYV
jgi:hypothetical protein